MSTNSTRLLLVLLPLVACDVTVADWRVWTVTDTRHVLRSEPAANESVVGATHASPVLAAARNEWVSFQILLRSDEPVKGVCVRASELRGPNAAVLRPSESRLYRQHQLHLEIGTYRNDAFKPDWYPDPLIPFDTKRVGGASGDPNRNEPRLGTRPTLRAIPFDLPVNETHGFWIDLYVPAETAPGEYRGTYRVTAEGGKSWDVPIVLTVWDFTLPHTPTLVTAFGSPAERIRGPSRQRGKAGKDPQSSDWQAIEMQCAQLLSEHRFNAVPPSEMLRPVAQNDGSFQIPAEQVRALREFVDRYHVNALDVPHPSSVIKDPEAERDKLRAWLAAFDRAAKELDRPHIVFYVYLKDEPNTREDYEYVQKWGRAIRAAKSVVQVMVVEQTWTQPGLGGADSAWGDLYGAVDIWCPLFSLHRQETAAKRQALGETVWAYTALCQGEPTPWWHIDYPLLNYRVPAWMAWRDGMKGLLYWGGMSYWRETDDPWLHAPVYTGKGVFQQGDKGIRFNGEGSLVYPAQAVGYDGIVPTIRLKALRDAIEDYEYLAILSRLGKSAEADKIVRRLTESWFQWDKDPAAYERARVELAALIVSASSSRAEAPADKPAREVSVTVDWSTPQIVSNFEIGLTHVHYQWDQGHPEAVARVKSLLGKAIRFHNQHITHWGVDNDLMPGPGKYEWSTLDHRMELIRSIDNSVPVITFCGAPAWMKDYDPKAKWQVEVRVRDENVPDFAALCQKVALRYPQVEYFQIWNEFKGYWIPGGRDVARFTVMYNAVYDAVKSARPNVKIGGPYLSMGGRSLSANDRQVMDYWRQHSRGADFLTFDGWLEGWPPGGKTEDWMMGRTQFFGDLVKEFQTILERPVWISEFYGGRSKNPQFTAANHASCYYHSLRSGARMALLWDGVGLGQLFTRTEAADGGQPTPHYFVVQAFNRDFGPGTQLYQAKSSSGDIEVLASRAKIMLINKRPDVVRVRLKGKDVPLEGYEVRVLDVSGVGVL